MNIINDIAVAEKKQELLSKLNQLIADKLPPALDESAKEHGVLIRKREIKSALDLIKVMLIYAVTDISQRLLAAFAGILGIAKISDQAWQKKWQRANLGWLFY